MTRALKGRKILITRARAQASDLRRLLEERGAEVFEVPTIAISPRRTPELDRAIRSLSGYDWIIFTSPNGARIFFQRLDDLVSRETVRFPKICAIGPATAAEVTAHGFAVDLQPRQFQAEGILESLAGLDSNQFSGLGILLPRASAARDVLPDELRKGGARVDVIHVYDTILPEESREILRKTLANERIDLIVFTSSSTVRNFVELVPPGQDLQAFRCAAIGPITAATAEELCLPVVVQPQRFTIPDLVEAIELYLAR